ncbi:MAG: flagellar biosynthetic protein FliO [Candidatus Cloacimonadota bacterium]|nr:flagellar biosynthetic protein FliO [Candidatus Cloacimonadota bacterium]
MQYLLWFFLNIKEQIDSTKAVPDSISTQLKIPSFSAMFLRMMIALAITIALIYLVSYIFKRISKQGITSNAIDPSAKILGTFSLNSKQLIYIVYLFEEILLLSSTQEQISLIDKISDQTKIKKILATNNKNNGNKFNDLFEKIIRKKSEKE